MWKTAIFLNANIVKNFQLIVTCVVLRVAEIVLNLINQKTFFLNSGNDKISWYVLNFLTDYFSVNEFTKKLLNIDLNDEVQEKNAVHVYNGSNIKIMCIIRIKKLINKNILIK